MTITPLTSRPSIATHRLQIPNKPRINNIPQRHIQPSAEPRSWAFTPPPEEPEYSPQELMDQRVKQITKTSRNVQHQETQVNECVMQHLASRLTDIKHPNYFARHQETKQELLDTIKQAQNSHRMLYMLLGAPLKDVDFDYRLDADYASSVHLAFRHEDFMNPDPYDATLKLLNKYSKYFASGVKDSQLEYDRLIDEGFNPNDPLLKHYKEQLDYKKQTLNVTIEAFEEFKKDRDNQS